MKCAKGKFSLNTTGFPPGRYRYLIELRGSQSQVLKQTALDFEITK